MNARALTLALLATSAGLAIWVCLRDWESPISPAGERSRAQFAAQRITDAVRPGCPRCSAQLLRSATTGAWSVRLRGPTGTRCLRLDPEAFSMAADSGFAGLRPGPCP